jgi:hypothetical protein
MIGYLHPTKRGPVVISPIKGRWCVVYDNENLGSYHTPSAAADDVAGGHTFAPSSGVDLGELGISADIADWKRVHVSTGYA